ncbi:transcriptional regulator [Cutibacterium acnes JCM 18916]|nr:transcriptional regulator [Cutibacterium acnes JCM 18916]
MTDREHIQTLLTVARRYWLEQATQAEIAAEIGYSRSMVSRLLDEARRRGSSRSQCSILWSEPSS